MVRVAHVIGEDHDLLRPAVERPDRVSNGLVVEGAGVLEEDHDLLVIGDGALGLPVSVGLGHAEPQVARA